jgi:hypothetical protein
MPTEANDGPIARKIVFVAVPRTIDPDQHVVARLHEPSRRNISQLGVNGQVKS